MDSSRRTALRDALVGGSLMNLLYIDVWRVLFSAKRPSAFFLTVARTHYFTAIAAVVFVALVSPLLGWGVRRLPTLLQRAAMVVFLGTLIILFDRLRKSSGVTLPAMTSAVAPLVHLLGRAGLVVLGFFAFIAVVRFAKPLSRAYQRLLLVLSPFIGYTFARALFLAATLDFTQFADIPRPIRPELPSPGRAVIVVFDELDYETVFDKPVVGLKLPHLDSLRNTAVAFDSALSPGANTLESLTSYFYEQRVARVQTTGPRSLIAHLTNGQLLNSDTAKSFLNMPPIGKELTAVIGFSLPYCRIGFATTADYCDWLPFGTGVSSGGSRDAFFTVVARQLESLHPLGNRRVHVRRIGRVLKEAAQLAADSSYSVVFLHLPLPHLPPVWNRTMRDFVDNNNHDDGYYDNVALVDSVVGKLRGGMVRSGVWDRTTFILTSDHPLRSKLLDGKDNDRRIPLFVKLPQERVGVRYTDPINSLFITSILKEIVTGQLMSPEELRARAVRAVQKDPSLLIPARQPPHGD